MPDYRAIDWTQDPPSQADYEAGWLRSELTLVEKRDQRLSELTYALSNGGVDTNSAQFRLDADPAVAWFLARRRLGETSFFEDFFAHPVVRDYGLPEGGADRDAPIDFGFKPEGTFLAMGRLAQTVLDGAGAGKFQGDADQITALTRGVADAAFGGRHGDVTTYVSRACWGPWFNGHELDLSMLWIDPATGMVTVILATGRY